jgi:hypothetical protein
MTYASEFFSWTAGHVEADTYFCPERHGTYFGGFYMKDMPAMGKRDYDISTSVTGESGRTSWKNSLNPGAGRLDHRDPRSAARKLLMEIVEFRRAFSVELAQAAPWPDARPGDSSSPSAAATANWMAKCRGSTPWPSPR